MNRLSRICSALVLVAFACGLAAAGEKGKTTVLYIGKNPDHPHGSHMYMHVGSVLAECLKGTSGVQTVVSNGWPKDAAVLEGVDTIVVYTSPAAEILLDGPHRDQVDKLMKSGVGLVTIHWASSVGQKNFERLGPAWMSYLGGTWVSNAGLSGGASPLKQLVPDHPICRGWQEYEIDDEYYLKPVMGDAKPLLSVREKKMGDEVIVGWAFERPDGGRAFGTTLGHPYANFQIEAFRRMIVNAVLWTAHVEVPKDGAPVSVRPEVLALPAKE
jgi:type 1 glutamine amidotransferase